MTLRHSIIIIITTVTAFITISSGSVSAAIISPIPAEVEISPTITTIDKLKKIEILKEKIATKVAELRKMEKGGVFGEVKSVNENSITITSKSKDLNVSIAEDTIFFNLKDGVKSDPLDNKQANKLKPGNQIAALGYFDSTGTSLSTKYIYVYTPRVRITGKIADKDQANYTITVKGSLGNTLVDIETYTKIYTYSKKDGLVKGGFSKLKENDIVHIFATANPKEDNRYSGNKIISLAIGSNTSLPTPTEEKEASPTAKPAGK